MASEHSKKMRKARTLERNEVKPKKLTAIVQIGGVGKMIKDANPLMLDAMKRAGARVEVRNND